MAITFNHNDKFYVNGSNVGIGTSTPEWLIQLHESTSGANYIKFTNSSTGEDGGNGMLIGISSSEQATIWNYENTNMRFATNGTERVTITNIGRVGIGTTDPTRELEVAGAIRAYGTLSSYSNGAFLARYDSGTGIESGELVLAANGKTGWEDDVDEFGRIRFYSTDGSGIGARDAAVIKAINGNGDGSTTTTFSGELAFFTSKYNANVAEAVRIDKDGNVGIGTTSPDNKLMVQGASTDGSASTGNVALFEGPSGTNGLKIFVDDTENAAGLQTISLDDLLLNPHGGNVGIGTTSPNEELEVKSASFTTVSVNTDRNTAGENIGSFAFYGHNDATTPENMWYTRIMSSMTDVTDGSENGDIFFQQLNDGTGLETFRVKSSGTIQFPTYGAGYLRTDADGNVIVDISTVEDTLDTVTTRGNSTTNSIVVGGVGSSGEIALYSTGTADATNTEYDSHVLRFSTSGWDTNNSVARNVHWNIRSESASNIYPDAYLTFYEESPSYDHWKLKLPGRGSGSGYIHPDAALFNGNIGIYESDTSNLKISLKPTGDSYFTNNLGIGTTSPGGRLELNGSGQSWSTAPAIRMWDSFNSKGWLVGNVNNITAGDFYIRTLPGEDTNPGASNNEFTIKHATGNVGIGTTSPAGKLHVYGDRSYFAPAGDSDSGNSSDAIVIYNPHDTAFTADALTAYNAHTSWDIGSRSTYTISSRTKNGSVYTFAGEHASAAVAINRYVQLNSNNDSPLLNWTFYQWDGAGTAATDLKVPNKVWTVQSYQSGGSDTLLILNGDGTLQLSQYGAGYLKTDASGNVTVDTDIIEDTLDSVTDRGNTTTNSISVGEVTLSNAPASNNGTFVKVYSDNHKRMYTATLNFSFTAAGTYNFNLVFPNSGGYQYELTAVNSRNGLYRNFGTLKDSSYIYWESDEDFTHRAEGDLHMISSYTGGMYFSADTTYFLSDGVTDSVQTGTANWSYAIVRYSIYIPRYDGDVTGSWKLHLTTYGDTGSGSPQFVLA